MELWARPCLLETPFRGSHRALGLALLKTAGSVFRLNSEQLFRDVQCSDFDLTSLLPCCVLVGKKLDMLVSHGLVDL